MHSGTPFYASLLTGAGGPEPKGLKPSSLSCLRGRLGHNNTKPSGSSRRRRSAPLHGRQAGTISLEVCRARNRQGDWGGHLEGQTVP
jgi:hypothetical protein